MSRRFVIVTLLLQLLCGASAARSVAAADVEAIAGIPFGVGRLTTVLSPADGDSMLALEALVLEEARGRLLYPTFQYQRPGRLLAAVTGAPATGPATVTAYFLFTGQDPLELTLYGPGPQRFEVRPRSDASAVHAQWLGQWWNQYRAAAERQAKEGDYPPLVQSYLTTMLARRLGFSVPPQEAPRQPGEFQETFELLLGLEPYRLETLQRTNMSTSLVPDPISDAVPGEVPWPRMPAPVKSDAAIEDLALHVPEECFYIRFGTFANYLWFRKLLDESGGELGRLVTLRGFDPKLALRQERQLALKPSSLAELVGGQVIKDVAYLGRDTYMREGGAFGILFETHPGRGFLLTNDIQTQHAAAQRREADRGAASETVEIAGRQVEFLSTPDNRLRTFYAQDGDFHLVTTSRAIVERFFEAGQGERSLGQSPEFLHARAGMPLQRDDTVFLFFSPQFFQGLLSPQYQIELARRMQSATDIELVQLARLAARAEGRADETLGDLVNGGFLPAGFGRRSDGSGPVLAEHVVLDSRRGARGSFLPIPDVDLGGATAQEVASYQRKAEYYRNEWRQLDPLMIGIKRYRLEGERLERIVVDAHVSPFHEDKYQFITGMLGPPIQERMSAPAGAIITAQMSVRGGLIFSHVPQHILFAGVLDTIPPTDLQPKGFFESLRLLRTVPGYLGAWPKPGFLEMLPLGLGGGPPDALGYSRMLIPPGLWRRQWDDFSAFSFDYRVLSDVTPQFQTERAETDAQIMVQVGDISQSQFAQWVNAMNYSRARQTTVGNLRFLHHLAQQMRLARPDALSAAEDLIDAQLVCSLGGQYRLVEPASGLPWWTSSKLSADGDATVPADYQAPMLGWFRGLTAELSKSDDRLIVHAELDMQRAAQDPSPVLPLFNLFQGPPKKTKAASEAPPAANPARQPVREF